MKLLRHSLQNRWFPAVVIQTMMLLPCVAQVRVTFSPNLLNKRKTVADLPNPQTCDVCGTIKRDANHWWRVFIDELGLVCICPWSRLPKFSHNHACGEEHALKIAARLMVLTKPAALSNSGTDQPSDGPKA